MCRTFFFFFSFLLSCNFNIIYKCVCAEQGAVGHACRCMSECACGHACVCACMCVCARTCFMRLLNSYSADLKVGFYIMKWNVIYKCVCVCWTFILPILVLDIGLYFTSEHYSYVWHVCVCVCVCACVCARSCRCEYVHLGVVLLVQMGC